MRLDGITRGRAGRAAGSLYSFFPKRSPILGFCKLRDRHGGAAPYWDPARRAAATGATPVAGATHGGARASQGERRPVGAATHEDRRGGEVRGDTCFGVAKTQGGVNFACYKIHEITPYTFMCREFSKPGPLKSSPPLNLVPGNFACYKTEWAL